MARADGAERRVAGAGDRFRPPAEGPANHGLDWPGLMRAGLHGLRLRPAEFWDLTPAELAMMLGIEFGAGAMSRARLGDLMARFPDGPPSGQQE